MRLIVGDESSRHGNGPGGSPQMWGMVHFGAHTWDQKDTLAAQWRHRSEVQCAAGDNWCLVWENGTEDDNSLVSSGVAGLHAAVAGDVWPLQDGKERGAPLIASLYRTHGSSLINQCDGQCAAAVIDERHRRTVLTVNWPGGFHRLYYCTDEDMLAFATRLDLLVHRCGWQARVDEQAVVDLLRFGGLVTERSLLEGVRRVVPGFAVVWEDGHATQSRAYECPLHQDGASGDILALTRLHRQAIERRLADHRDFGLFLSGGLDSGFNVAVVAGLSTKPVKTFSVAFDVTEFDESAHARLVATKYKTDHHELRLTTAGCLDRLPEMVWAMQEPIIDYSYVPMFYIAEAMKQHVDLAIGGDGPDHLLGRNYQFAAWHDLLSGIPFARHGAAWAVAVDGNGAIIRRRFWQHARGQRLGRQLWQALACSGDPCGAGMLNGFCNVLWGDCSPNDLARLLSPDLLRRTHVAAYHQAWTERWQQGEVGDSQDCFILADTSLSGLCGVFAKVGTMCSAHNLVIREPYLAGPLIRYFCELPHIWKVRGGWPKRLTRAIPTPETKRMLRHAAARYLPDEIVWQKQKHGFEFPLVKCWQESTSRAGTRHIFGALLDSTDWLDPMYLDRLVREQAAGARNHRYMLLLLAALDQWFRIFIQGRAEPPDWRWASCF